MCAAFLVGGGILLTYSLAQVQIRVVYSDIVPLDNLSNEQRSLILQGRGVHYFLHTCPKRMDQVNETDHSRYYKQ